MYQDPNHPYTHHIPDLTTQNITKNNNLYISIQKSKKVKFVRTWCQERNYSVQGGWPLLEWDSSVSPSCRVCSGYCKHSWVWAELAAPPLPGNRLEAVSEPLTTHCQSRNMAPWTHRLSHNCRSSLFSALITKIEGLSYNLVADYADCWLWQGTYFELHQVHYMKLQYIIRLFKHVLWFFKKTFSYDYVGSKTAVTAFRKYPIALGCYLQEDFGK